MSLLHKSSPRLFSVLFVLSNVLKLLWTSIFLFLHKRQRYPDCFAHTFRDNIFFSVLFCWWSNYSDCNCANGDCPEFPNQLLFWPAIWLPLGACTMRTKRLQSGKHELVCLSLFLHRFGCWTDLCTILLNFFFIFWKLLGSCWGLEGIRIKSSI